jgi:hypothetical protein
MKGELEFPGLAFDIEQRKSWLDPFFGLRYHWRMAEK